MFSISAFTDKVLKALSDRLFEYMMSASFRNDSTMDEVWSSIVLSRALLERLPCVVAQCEDGALCPNCSRTIGKMCFHVP